MHQANDTESTTPRRRGGFNFRRLHWSVVLGLLGIHALALLAFVPALFSWTGLLLCLFFYWVTGGLGITLCYHRLLTHRSFKTPKWFEYFLTLCGCIAWQGGPIEWVGMHRLHHKHADTDEDPHSPDHGFSWSHVLWLLHREIDGLHGADAAKDLARDAGMRWLNRFFWVPQLALAAGLFAIGWAASGPMLGLSWVVWAVALRTVLVFHTTWFVNSASHTWGYQNYPETGEHSTNLWWVALLSFGEGWHNNHHAHPRSAAHGLRWYELDATYWTIRLLGLVGLAHDIKKPSPEQMPSPSRADQSASSANSRATSNQ